MLWAQDADARAWVAVNGKSTLEECARAYGISRQCVTEIEKPALAKIRGPAAAGYGPEDVDAMHTPGGALHARYG